MQFEGCSAMRRIGAMNGTQHAQIVDMLRHLRKQLTHRQTAFAMAFKPPGRFQQIALFGERDPRQIKRQRFSAVAVQQRLGVEGVHMGRATLHEQKDNSLCSRNPHWNLG